MQGNFKYDMPQDYYFGGGAGTTATPAGLVFLLIAIVLILWLPRRRVMLPLLFGAVLLPGTSIAVIGLHFTTLRLLVGVGWLRFAIRRDFTMPRLQSIDKFFLAWALSNAIAYSLLWQQLGAVTNRFGFLWTALGGYFLVRVLIRNENDIMQVMKTLAILVLIIAPTMEWEHITQHNLFAFLGSPPLSQIRNGSIRAEGPFEHPIIAGTVGAMLVPIFVGIWWRNRKQRVLAALAVAGSMVMMVASASSTPLMTFAAGILALMAFPLRSYLRYFRWGLVILLVSLQLVMKAPVWFLISRVGGSIGGSGYHRAMLIDGLVRHLGEWWLVGTRNNMSWGYDMWDVDNAFVAAGVEGGLVTFCLFIGIIVCAFKRIGRSLKATKGLRQDTLLVWSLGVCVFANVIGFFGIIYFDQSILIWYLILAMVAATAHIAAEARKVDIRPKVKDPYAIPDPLEFPAAGMAMGRQS